MATPGPVSLEIEIRKHVLALGKRRDSLDGGAQPPLWRDGKARRNLRPGIAIDVLQRSGG